MKTILYLASLALVAVGCTNPNQKTAEKPASASSTELPYTAIYSSNVNQEISDEDLLMVLNSYKAWETGDMQSLRTAFGDSIVFNGSDGTDYLGPVDPIIQRWIDTRDSLVSVKLDIAVWTKNNFPDKGEKNITVWYTETDIYKDGRVIKADMHDINGVKDGKINWYAQYRRVNKPK